MSYKADGDLADLFKVEPMQRAARRTVERVGESLHGRVRRHTPVAKPPPGAASEWLAARHRLPGTLKESWRIGEVTVLVQGERLSIDVFTEDPVAPDVEWDTMPHLIVGRDGMLRFWDKTGRKVFAKVVHHPGTKGAHMMATSLVEVAASWREIGREEMARWSREAFR